jgi:hypothetical protein
MDLLQTASLVPQDLRALQDQPAMQPVQIVLRVKNLLNQVNRAPNVLQASILQQKAAHLAHRAKPERN